MVAPWLCVSPRPWVAYWQHTVSGVSDRLNEATYCWKGEETNDVLYGEASERLVGPV